MDIHRDGGCGARRRGGEGAAIFFPPRSAEERRPSLPREAAEGRAACLCREVPALESRRAEAYLFQEARAPRAPASAGRQAHRCLSREAARKMTASRDEGGRRSREDGALVLRLDC